MSLPNTFFNTLASDERIARVTQVLEANNFSVVVYETGEYPLEDARTREARGQGSIIGKILIVEREIIPGRITMVLVKDRLGF